MNADMYPVIYKVDARLKQLGYTVQWEFGVDMIVSIGECEWSDILWYVDFLEENAVCHIGFRSSLDLASEKDKLYENGLSLWYSDQTTIYEQPWWNEFNENDRILPEGMANLLERIYGKDWKNNAHLTFSIGTKKENFILSNEKLS